MFTSLFFLIFISGASSPGGGHGPLAQFGQYSQGSTSESLGEGLVNRYTGQSIDSHTVETQKFTPLEGDKPAWKYSYTELDGKPLFCLFADLSA